MTGGRASRKPRFRDVPPQSLAAIIGVVFAGATGGSRRGASASPAGGGGEESVWRVELDQPKRWFSLEATDGRRVPPAGTTIAGQASAFDAVVCTVLSGWSTAHVRTRGAA